MSGAAARTGGLEEKEEKYTIYKEKRLEVNKINN